jgi:hypothetical protein
MNKKLPLQGGEPIRGDDTPSIVQDGYSGKIPTTAIIALEWELAKIVHGTASLTLHVRDGKLARFTTGRERSHMAETGNGE